MEYHLVVQKIKYCYPKTTVSAEVCKKVILQKSRRYTSELALHVMYQVLMNPSLPTYLKNFICHSTHICVAGNLRSNANNDELLVIHYVKCKTLAWSSFSVAGPRLWNNLPSEITTINDTQMFKKALKTNLFCKYYYS